MENFDVTVVGGGIAGLCTAALLSREGRSCLVLEQLPIPGGRARVVEKDGFTIDYGIHVHRFAAEGKAAQVLRKLGIRRRFLPVGAPLIYHAGKFVKFPKTPIDILSSPLLDFTSKLKMIKMLVTVLTARNTESLYGKTVAEWLEETGIREPDLLEMTSLLCTAGLVCGDINRASAGELFDFLRTAVRAKEATGYLLGGWDVLIERLVRIIEQNGEVRTGVRVESVTVEENTAIGVWTDGGEIRSRAVVVNVPLQDIGKLLKQEHFTPEVWERARTLEPTAGINIDFCLSKKITPIDGIIFTMEPCTMGVFTSNVEPALAPRGSQLGTWYYPLPVEKMSDKEFVKTERMRLKGLIENMFPGIWKNVVYERVIAMDMVDGAMPIVGQTWKDRPAVDCSLVRGLFFAGDCVGVPGEGGDIAFNSSLTCSQKTSQYLK